MIKLVMFDWDGTIVDGLSLNYKIYIEITKRLGKRMPESPQDLAKLTNGKYEELYHNLGIRTKDEVEKATKSYWELFESLKDEFELFPGIMEVISSLKKRGIRIAIISNCEKPLLAILIDKFGLSGYLDLVVAHGDTENIKPEPDQIHFCLEKLKVKPKEAIFVGDMINDIVAARKANLRKVIAVTYGWHTREQLEKLKPDVIVDKTDEILENL
ncbi:MAG: HAD-IA family hydrolase [Candidatus Aenigmarchaeota archaeon]|nr:HAD-IA family hydrolase [Candidatus Aenigmarchaeota archaeon]